MNRNLLFLELVGGGFVAVCSLFMRRLYAICDGELLGILFGSVNGSIWESCKTLLLPFLLWALIEAMTLKLRFHRFTVVKTVSLYALAAVYIALRLIGARDSAAAVIGVSAALALSFALYCSTLPVRWFFAPSLALLFLFVSLYFSLTPFPPHRFIFLDGESGVYGIVPRSFDYGAKALNTIYCA